MPPAWKRSGSTTKPSLGKSWYVSKNGNNADGTTWATAWNELNMIVWASVAPGDTVLLDGGSTSMTYTTQMTVQKSGTATAPITIKLAGESGRNGQVIVFGGRATLLPNWGGTGATEGARTNGIDMGSVSYVTMNGVKWSGILVHGTNSTGLRLNPANNHLIFRNLEIRDCGTPGTDVGYGVLVAGTDLVFDRMNVHDNGQDSFHSSYESVLSNVTIENSWLYSERRKPDGTIWNVEAHADGFQIWAGGTGISGINIRHCCIGPGFMQGVILGDPVGDTVVSGVTITDTLFYGCQNAAIHSGETQLDALLPLPTGWHIERVTIDLPPPNTLNGSATVEFIDFVFGSGNLSQLTVLDSIFTGGWGAQVPLGGTYTGNVQYTGRTTVNCNGQSGTVMGPDTDPLYATAATGTLSMSANFALAANSPVLGKGSSVLSGQQLVDGG